MGVDAIKDVFTQLIELIAAGKRDDAEGAFLAFIQAFQADNERLQHQLDKMRRRIFGRRSEKISTAQLSLLALLATGANGANDNDQREADKQETDHEPLNEDEWQEVQAHRRRPRRREALQLDHLPHEVIVVEVDDAQKKCPCCDHARDVIGFEETRTLERVPASFKVIVHKRPKLACANCKQSGVIVPDAPDKPIDRGLPGCGLLADIVVSKFGDHQPLERISRIYGRDGLAIPSNTLGDWVAKASDILAPVAKAIMNAALGAAVLHTDDTPVRVLDKQAPGGSKKGHLWAYLGDKQALAFDYTPDWKSDRPRELLKDRVGWMAADRYRGYDRLYRPNGGTIDEVGCWSHTRRKFVEALDADKRATEPLRLIKQIYRIEELARARRLDPDGIRELRQKRSASILQRFSAWLERMRGKVPPKEPLGMAIVYADNSWAALNRFLEDGRLEVDNNAAERALRPIAVGRKNWLFAGSDAGGERAAILYSVVGTAMLNGVQPRTYIEDIIAKIIGGWPAKKIAELLPFNWSNNGAKKEAA